MSLETLEAIRKLALVGTSSEHPLERSLFYEIESVARNATNQSDVAKLDPTYTSGTLTWRDVALNYHGAAGMSWNDMLDGIHALKKEYPTIEKGKL